MSRQPMIVLPGAGRRYSMGRMQAVFKADEEETAHQCSVSEWWLEPGSRLPNAHAHEEDHVFYVIEGTLSLFLDDHWTYAERGAYIVIPGGAPHAFENRSTTRTGFISINLPGGFEKRMPAIAAALAEVNTPT